MSGVQSHALDSMKEKLNDAELALQHEKQGRARFEVCERFASHRTEKFKQNSTQCINIKILFLYVVIPALENV